MKRSVSSVQFYHKIVVLTTLYIILHTVGLLTIDNVHYSCNFICVVSDVLIKTMNE